MSFPSFFVFYYHYFKKILVIFSFWFSGQKGRIEERKLATHKGDVCLLLLCSVCVVYTHRAKEPIEAYTVYTHKTNKIKPTRTSLHSRSKSNFKPTSNSGYCILYIIGYCMRPTVATKRAKITWACDHHQLHSSFFFYM
jgi:hypothetical protein